MSGVVFPYPGSKKQAVHILDRYIPKGTKSMASPFFGSGAFEMHSAHKGIDVFGADAFEPLVNFWKQLKRAPRKLSSTCNRFVPETTEDYHELLQKMHESRKYSKVFRAACFYNTIRTSFSGIAHGTFMPRKVSRLKNAIPSLISFDTKKLHIEHSSFEKFIPKHTDKWMYVDPPYYVPSRLYGNKGGGQTVTFDHVLLRDVLQHHPSWLLSYNDSPYIRRLYKGHKIVKVSWTYRMNDTRKSNEILIFSKPQDI
jgi:DNA adenine methylase